MINYDKVSLSVLDYEGNKVGELYSPHLNLIGRARDITLIHKRSGWKELSFTIPKTIDGGKSNPITESLVNEYLILVDDGSYKDVFIINEPDLIHNKASMTISAKCEHISARLRTKKLSLSFDDTNGIGTCGNLAGIILQGTGWNLGAVDTFVEPDGVTEKIRTLKTENRQGAYQLIIKLCELFNAQPVFHGYTRTVDIVAFSPYTSVPGQEYPTINNPDELIELCYTKGMSGVTRTEDTKDMITRLYVEGEYGDDGYLGIESVNPTGLDFILNFDYLASVGLFKPEHQAIVDQYLLNIKAAKDAAKNASLTTSGHETDLMNLWGTADYSLYDITSVIARNKFGVTHVTSLTDVKEVVAGQSARIIYSDGSHLVTSILTVSPFDIETVDSAPAGKTPISILIYRKPASGTIGGKESAAEAAQSMRETLSSRIGDNLVLESDTLKKSNQSQIADYSLSEDWVVGKKYTLSIWGTVNSGNGFLAYRDDGTTALPAPIYDSGRRCWVISFTCPSSSKTNKRLLRIINSPAGTATSATINRVKVEFGSSPTYWSAAKDSSQSNLIQEYTEKIAFLFNGDEENEGIYSLTAKAIASARLLKVSLSDLKTRLEAVEAIDSEFSLEMGDLLRDGYWQDSNYIVGQEESLFADAVEILKIMSKPVSSYSLSIHYIDDSNGKPLINASVRSPVHIIDTEATINDWGYAEQVNYVLDNSSKSTIAVGTKDAKFAGQSFTQTLAQIAETASKVRAMQDVYKRAEIIGKGGSVSTKTLQGVIDTEITRLLSSTSNWYTDEKGNMIFLSHDGLSAMMLTGEGFMIAQSKTPTGDWNWRTFGTGRGFTADEINSGTLNAGLIKILGTDQFYWDADNIHIFDPANPLRQIRIGRYDGTNYGIGFTADDGETWESAIGFDGGHLGAAEWNNINEAISTEVASQLDGIDLDIDLSAYNKHFNEQPYPPYLAGDTWTQIATGKSYVCTTPRPSGSFVQSDWLLKESTGIILRGTKAQMDSKAGMKIGDIWVIENDTSILNGRTYYCISTVTSPNSWIMTSVGAVRGAAVEWDANTGEVKIVAGKKATIASGGELEFVGNNKVTIGTGGQLNLVGSEVNVDAASTFNLRAGTGSAGLGISNNHVAKYAFWAGNIDPALADFAVKDNGDIIARRIIITNNNIENIDAAKITTGFIPIDRINAHAITADKIYAGEIASLLLTSQHIKAGAITSDRLYSGEVHADRITSNHLYAGTLDALKINALNIAANAIEGQHIKAGAVTANKIYAGSVEADKITASHIKLGSLTGALLEGGTITGDKILAGTIKSNLLYAGSVEADKIKAANIGADQITATHIAANSVVAENIVGGTITGDKISAGTLTGDLLYAGAVEANKIKAASIGAEQIVGSHIAADEIVGRHIAGETITAEHILAKSLTSEQIAAETIVSDNIAAGSIESNRLYTGELETLKISSIHIASQSIVADNIAAGTITSGKLYAGDIEAYKIGAQHIASDSIRAEHIAAGSIVVGSAIIVDGAITNAKIANGAIDSLKVQNAAIQTAHIANAAIKSVHIDVGIIGTAHIENGAITFAKIYSGTANELKIQSANIANAAITSAQIAELAVTDAKIQNGAITNLKVQDGAITSAKIGQAAIQDVHIQNGVITSLKIYSGTANDLKIQNANIADATITGAKIKNGEITTVHIGSAGIDFAKIKNVVINEGMIGNGVIDTVHIKEGSITEALIGSLSANVIKTGTLSVERLEFTNSENSIIYQLNNIGDLVSTNVSKLEGYVLEDSTVHADKIIAGTISARHIGADQINANHILAGSITVDHISGGKITGDWIKANTITTGHISADFGATLDLSSNQGINLKITNALSDKLDASVLDSLALKSELSSYVTSTEFGIQQGKIIGSISSIEESVDGIIGAEGSLTTFKSKVDSWMEFSQDGLLLGKSNSRFQVMLTNERLSFKQDGAEIAYLSNNKLYISASEVINQMVIGNSSDGYMTLDVSSDGGLICTRSLTA